MAERKEFGVEKDSGKIIRKLFWSLLPVQAMAVGLPAINILLDTCIVGNLLGQEALAAMGFTGPLNLLLKASSSLIASGAQLLCAQRLGRGDEKGVKSVFNSAMLLCLLVGFCFAAVVLCFPLGVAQLLGAEGQAAVNTVDYIRGWSLGMAFSMVLACVLPFAQMERMGKHATASVAVMLLVNLGFDVINTTVWKQGLLGVGLATTYSNIAALAVVLPALLKRSKLFRIAPESISGKTLVGICYQGAPSSIMLVCLLIRDRVLNQYIFALGGTAAMSAMAIAGNIKTAVGAVFQAGYNGSGRLIASVLAGQRDSSSLRDLSRIMVRSGGPVYALIYAAVFLLARPIVYLFGATAENAELYIMALRVSNLFYLVDIFKAPPLCTYQALGKVKLLVLLNVLDNTVFPVVLCRLFAETFGLPLVFGSNALSVSLILLVMAGYFTVHAKRPPRSLAELAYIPSTISAPRENRMKAVLRTVEDCVNAAAAAEQFCLQKGMPRQKAMYCGLCIEEMSVDAVVNRFQDEKTTMDLRLIYENGGMTILMRDDCKRFDPKAWLELCSPEDASRSIGIRMVRDISEEMNYTTTLGLNVLTIRI